MMQRIFSKVAVVFHGSYWGPICLHFVDWGDQSLVPNIGEDARAKDDVNLLWLQCRYRDKCHQQPLNSIALHTINITINIYIHEITSAI